MSAQDTVYAERIEKDRQLIEQHICPVCGKNVGAATDKRRALKQHCARAVGGDHKLWVQMYWPVHFRRGGDRYMPRKQSVQDVITDIRAVYGATAVDELRAWLSMPVEGTA